MLRPSPPCLGESAQHKTACRTLNSEGRLAAVACHFNPCGYRRQRENFRRFQDAWRGCPLYTLEVSFDGNYHLSTDWRIPADGRNLMWQKEPLINEMVRRLPERFDRVAWVDADLLFLNDEWAGTTSELLDDVPVVQLFENCQFTTARGTIGSCNPSLLRKRRDQLAQYGSPGGAWGARRELFERHGLYASHIVGGGDSCFADAVFGRFDGYLTTVSPPALNASFREWGRRLYDWVRGRVGCTPGDVVHLFHGTHANRRYVERTAILRDAEFNPAEDVRVGASGLLEWTGHKPELERRVREYFLARQEDA